jgi:hypothetical protein
MHDFATLLRNPILAMLACTIVALLASGLSPPRRIFCSPNVPCPWKSICLGMAGPKDVAQPGPKYLAHAALASEFPSLALRLAPVRLELRLTLLCISLASIINKASSVLRHSLVGSFSPDEHRIVTPLFGPPPCASDNLC